MINFDDYLYLPPSIFKLSCQKILPDAAKILRLSQCCSYSHNKNNRLHSNWHFFLYGHSFLPPDGWATPLRGAAIFNFVSEISQALSNFCSIKRIENLLAFFFRG